MRLLHGCVCAIMFVTDYDDFHVVVYFMIEWLG